MYVCYSEHVEVREHFSGVSAHPPPLFEEGFCCSEDQLFCPISAVVTDASAFLFEF